MKPFNIDDCIPDYQSICVPRRGSPDDPLLQIRGISSPLHDRPGIGIRTSRFLDWRRLESRAYQVRQAADAARHDLFSALQRTYDVVWQGTEEPAMLLIRVNEEKILTFSDERGYFIDSSTFIMNRLERAPDYLGPFRLVKLEEGGREVGRLLRRNESLQRLLRMYDAVLYRALEDRIRTHVDAGTRWEYGRRVYSGAVYLILNEGRTRVASVDDLGSIRWLSDHVYGTSPGVATAAAT